MTVEASEELVSDEVNDQKSTTGWAQAFNSTPQALNWCQECYFVISPFPHFSISSFPISSFPIPGFIINELQKQSRDQTQAIKPADWSVWSRDRFCKLQATWRALWSYKARYVAALLNRWVQKPAGPVKLTVGVWTIEWVWLLICGRI